MVSRAMPAPETWFVVQMPVTFATAASYFSFADLWLTGSSVSQASSSNEVGFPIEFLKAASACFAWHLMTVPIILLRAFTMTSPHLRWSFESGGQPGSSPPKASVVVVVVVVGGDR